MGRIRNRKVNYDGSAIKFKTNINEKEALQIWCLKNDISMSNVIRKAVNEFTNQKMFDV